MKINTRKVKIEFEIDVPTYISDDGTKFELLDDTLIQTTEDVINIKLDNFSSFKKECLELDYIHQYNSFKIDTDIILNGLYDESNKDTYKHFVHHFMNTYYINYFNNKVFETYNPTSKLHERMINDTLFNVCSVKDLILIHLMSGKGKRTSGFDYNNKKVRNLNTEEIKGFYRFIFDTKMFDIHEKIKLSENLSKTNSINVIDFYKESKSYSIAELIILKCWRDKDLGMMQWLIDTYKLDMNIIDEKFKSDDSKYVSPFLNILRNIIDVCVHNSSGSGELFRDLGKELNVYSTYTDSYNKSIMFINFILYNWPDLVLEDNTKKILIKYNTIKDAICKNILKLLYSNKYNPIAKNGIDEFTNKLNKLI